MPATFPPQWLTFDGLANSRDVGGIPTTTGSKINNGVLLRSDNLQDLSAADLAQLRARNVTDVVDLRSHLEVNASGPGPLVGEPGITIHHHTLFREGDQPDELPWIGLTPSVAHTSPVTSHYLSYLADRPDSVVAALRVISSAAGATLVHCAAGKDRTGTVVALALLAVGAKPEAVVADYAASTERTQAILDRLFQVDHYRTNLAGRPLESHYCLPELMEQFIDHVTTVEGGIHPLLARLGWTDADTARLSRKLVG